MKDLLQKIIKYIIDAIVGIIVIIALYNFIIIIANWKNGISFQNRTIPKLETYVEEKLKKEHGIDAELKYKTRSNINDCALKVEVVKVGCHTPKNAFVYTLTGYNKNNEKQTIEVQYTDSYFIKGSKVEEKLTYQVFS